MYYCYNNRDTTPQPRLVYRAGAIYVETHVGVLARLDADSGALDWGYGYQTDPVQVAGIVSSVTDQPQEPRPARQPARCPAARHS